MRIPDDLKNILPEAAAVNNEGHLIIGGCDVVGLVGEFGTPLYLFDEATLRHKCREYRREFSKRYSHTLVIYACKAFLNLALAQILMQEGLGLDVVSGGELHVARSVDFPMEKVYFHGNNKTLSELRLALDWGVGRIVVDNFYELSLLDDAAQKAGVTQDILLRLSPGIDPHTHELTTTGIIDSKFGFPIVTGQAEEALVRAISSPGLRPVGLHVHLGSPIFEIEPYEQAIEVVLRFAAEMRPMFELLEFSPGGGFAIPYTRHDSSPSVAEYAQAISSRLSGLAGELGLSLPRLVIEPGRSIVGRAGIALYSAGAVKDIPGVRKYVSLDGGMADNIRPALYGARYEALVANKMDAEAAERVALVGKLCESGDVLIKDIALPRIEPGDIVAVLVSGAYCLSMASNYNCSLKPAVVLVGDSKARLIQRRETYEDLRVRG
ncbi:MAG: diaminopimelate decarboxylase [Dehalococcoidia bacterium]|nr:Diaminopimelate decarboxylase [Chloroflexota bacterium]MBT9160379.1 Diaminopimelate decarboxylase [Chloroflexota bacterium]MBT9162356.1 Diaminopimelate decarboxylase [Chloroflexota bacterium]